MILLKGMKKKGREGQQCSSRDGIFLEGSRHLATRTEQLPHHIAPVTVVTVAQVLLPVTTKFALSFPPNDHGQRISLLPILPSYLFLSLFLARARSHSRVLSYYMDLLALWKFLLGTNSRPWGGLYFEYRTPLYQTTMIAQLQVITGTVLRHVYTRGVQIRHASLLTLVCRNRFYLIQNVNKVNFEKL